DDLGLQDLRPGPRPRPGRPRPSRRHRGRHGVPRVVRAQRLRRGRGDRGRAVRRPARLLDRLRALHRQGGAVMRLLRWSVRRGWMYACMLAVSAFALFPIYYVAVTSLKTRGEIYTRTPDLWPNHPQWSQYTRVLGEGHVGRALVNSLIVAGVTTLICVVVAGMAAYALARLEVPFRRALLML